jgi:hypothetical protein
MHIVTQILRLNRIRNFSVNMFPLYVIIICDVSENIFAGTPMLRISPKPEDGALADVSVPSSLPLCVSA